MKPSPPEKESASRARDITERNWDEDSLSRMGRIFDESPIEIYMLDAQTLHFTMVNVGARRNLGYSMDELRRLTPLDLKPKLTQEMFEHFIAPLRRGEKDVVTFESEHQRKDGSLYPVEVSLHLSAGEVTPVFVAIIQNITLRKEAEGQIHQLAFYDPLTRLPNRSLLRDRLQQALTHCARHKNRGAILFIDLDNFKTLNDTKGHGIGDLLLIDVAARLQDCVRSSDTVARLGGDEFVVLIEDLSEDARQAAIQARDVGEKVLAAVSQPFDLQGLEHHCSSSIGISPFCDKEVSVDVLLKQADTAMYQAKSAGRNTVRIFDPPMQAVLEIRAAMEADLRQALPNQQFRLYYQSQVNEQGVVVGAEALLRWQHPGRGLVAPMEFIPLAEETGLIVPIGKWVLKIACAQLKVWQADPLTCHLQLAINVSAREFRQPDFVEQVLAEVKQAGIDPLKLKLELTESLVLDNIAGSIEKMQLLRNAGLSFSMDDFGTGQSSLTNLKRLPLDQIKIDQSFVRDIATDPGDAAIVCTIIGMASNLGLKVIAEGVETQQQRDFLEHNGCYAYQGYLFGKPLPIEEFQNLVFRA